MTIIRTIIPRTSIGINSTTRYYVFKYITAHIINPYLIRLLCLYFVGCNLIFLSLATAYAEAIGAKTIYVGVNNVDYSGYPDCRPAFIKAFAEAARLGTCACDENWAFDIRTPLQALSKAEIIQKGIALGVDYSKTVSCYQADDDGRACGVCDSCILRKAGFASAGVADQTRYR